MKQAVILAGGKGTRLASRLDGRPKPLVEIGGEPLLGRQLRALADQGIEDVLLLVNHRAKDIADFVAAGTFPLCVTLRDDGDAPLGTAGALFAAMEDLDDEFLVVYGDTLFDIDVAAMLAHHRGHAADITLLVHPNDHPADSDLIELDDADRIVAMHGYPHSEDVDYDNLVNAAFYMCRREGLGRFIDTGRSQDLAKHHFPTLLGTGARLYGYRSFEYIKDIGTPSRLKLAEDHLKSGRVARARRSMPQRAVFVDRDGTLNELNGYISDPDQLRLIDGAGEAIARLNALEFRVIVTTNQPVIARGECDDAGMARIHRRLQTLLGHYGAFVDLIQYCPHHPDAGFLGEIPALKRRCECRKPGIALIEQGREILNVDLKRSWFIGDSTADMEAARRSGLTSILVRTGEAGADGKHPCHPDYVVADLAQAVSLIAGDLGSGEGQRREAVQ